MFRILTAVALATVPWASARAEGRASTSTLTLDLALARAFERSPALAEARAAIAEAEGRRRSAAAHLNPELALEGAARVVGGIARPDLSIALSQPIRLGGAREDRVAVAESELVEAEAGLEVARQALSAEVHAAFIDAVRAQELARLASAGAELSERLLLAAERRLEAGSATALDLYVSRAELGRAENARMQAEAEAFAARVVLALAVGDDPAAPPHASPGPERPLALPPLERVLASARERHAELAALVAARETARRRIALASSEATPVLALRAFFSVEGGADLIAGGGLSLPLPVLDRREGAIAEATAGASRAEASRARGELELVRRIAVAYESYRGARRATEGFEARVIGTLEESVDLLQRSYDAGKIGFTELLVLRRSILEARAVAVEARARAAHARVTLELALGALGMPATEERR